MSSIVAIVGIVVGAVILAFGLVETVELAILIGFVVVAAAWVYALIPPPSSRVASAPQPSRKA